MNYTILQDEAAFLNFLEWLPQLQADEVYMLCLFARKKYDVNKVGVKDDKCQLKRITCTKKTMLQKIRQMEVAIGAYKTGSVDAPQETLALYITINPRSQTEAAKKLLVTLAQRITTSYSNWNVQSLSLSELQKSCGTKHYFDLDIDDMSVIEVVGYLQGAINLSAVSVLETRGGLHVLVNLKLVDKQFEKTWYKSLTSIPGVDLRGDNLVPVPGCVQGGFVPVFTA